MAEVSEKGSVRVRRELRPGDVGAIERMHGAIYASEHGVGPVFQEDVARALAEAVDGGWPQRGGVWIVELGNTLAGTLALTEETERIARVRWFLLDASLRGRGLGKSLLSELVAEADEAAYELLRLETFSDLRSAAHLYRSHGFALLDWRDFDRWGPPLVLQHYERRRP